MRLRSRFWSAAAAGLWMASTAASQEPVRLSLDGNPAASLPEVTQTNQEMAERIVQQLRQSGQLRDYCIDVTYSQGQVELTGRVRDHAQREQAVRMVQGMVGVQRVNDRLALTSDRGVTQVQAQDTFPPPPKPAPSEAPKAPAAAAPQFAEPIPMYQSPNPTAYDLVPPQLPPYSWPTYAPYNNYSRVAYPLLYPYQSWPFIGPMYPFPKVPLGWRSVKLEWEDGHWWYKKVATKHDWWRVRYW